MAVNVPATLLRSPPLDDLTEQQKKDFLNRLDFIAEIPSRFKEGVASGKAARELLDELELDVIVNLAMPSVNQDELTAYFIHTSWLGYCSAKVTSQFLGDKIRQEIFRSSKVPSDSDAFRSLVLRELETLAQLTDLIDDCTIFERFLAILIGIDCVLSRLLHICCATRLIDLDG